ncbi:MAG: hypothetical protein PVF41_04235, partial [Methyloceanibacter sp.]
IDIVRAQISLRGSQVQRLTEPSIVVAAMAGLVTGTLKTSLRHRTFCVERASESRLTRDHQGE